jgi:hypothetical protein
VEDVVELHNCHVTGLAIHQVLHCCNTNCNAVVSVQLSVVDWVLVPGEHAVPPAGGALHAHAAGADRAAQGHETRPRTCEVIG